MKGHPVDGAELWRAGSEASVDDKKLMRGGRKANADDRQTLKVKSSEEEVSPLAAKAAAFSD